MNYTWCFSRMFIKGALFQVATKRKRVTRTLYLFLGRNFVSKLLLKTSSHMKKRGWLHGNVQDDFFAFFVTHAKGPYGAKRNSDNTHWIEIFLLVRMCSDIVTSVSILVDKYSVKGGVVQLVGNGQQFFKSGCKRLRRSNTVRVLVTN